MVSGSKSSGQIYADMIGRAKRLVLPVTEIFKSSTEFELVEHA
jgi:hypothetical protein